MTGNIVESPTGPLVIGNPRSDQTALSLVVPTFQEAENIAPFLRALVEVLESVLSGYYEIIVVDDDSPDGTGRIASEVAAAYPQIRVVRRRGGRELAVAVIRGWQVAKGRVLGTINADFQHPPELVAKMWTLIHSVDLVVASRYCSGGSVGNWSVARRMLSRGAYWVGRLIVPEVFSRVSDPLSGCFLCRREALAGVHLAPVGYKSLVEVLVHGRVQAIAECPYEMRARDCGNSKANALRSLDYLVQLCRLRKAMTETIATQ